MRCCTDQQAASSQQRAEKKIARLVLQSAVFLLAARSSLLACPLCVESIAKVSGLANGLNWSILLMLGVPVLVVSVISGIILKAHRDSAVPKE